MINLSYQKNEITDFPVNIAMKDPAGNAPQLLTASGNATIINNTANAISFEISIYKNGFTMNFRSWDTVEPGSKTNIAFNYLIEVEKDDLIEAYIRNNTNSDPLLVEGISVVLKK